MTFQELVRLPDSLAAVSFNGVPLMAVVAFVLFLSEEAKKTK